MASWGASAFAPRAEPSNCVASNPALADGAVAWTTFSAPEADTPIEWCRAVGPAHAAVAGGEATPVLDELVVATWNVRVGAGDVERFVQDLRAGIVTGRPVQDFVLLLQEAYRTGEVVPRGGVRRLTSRIDIPPPSGERVDVVELADRLALNVFYVPSMPNGIGAADRAEAEDRGNAVLATVPLAELGAIELPFEVQRRVAAAATISGITSAGNRWSLRVASGHLDTRSRWSRFLDTFGTGRSRQATALDRGLPGEAVVLGADLNTWGLRFLEDALDILYTRFPDTLPPDDPTFVVAGVLPRRLDHLLLRLPERFAADVRRADLRYGSDHFPLVGTIRFN